MATYYFAGDLRIPMAETIGPITNSRSVNLLHPDMSCSSETGRADAGRLRITQRQADRSTWLPDVLRNNKIMVSALEVASNGTMTPRSLYLADGRTLDPKVYDVETDAVKGHYMATQYAHDTVGVAKKAEADKILFWAVA